MKVSVTAQKYLLILEICEKIILLINVHDRASCDHESPQHIQNAVVCLSILVSSLGCNGAATESAFNDNS